jgi:hypothetical protein
VTRVGIRRLHLKTRVDLMLTLDDHLLPFDDSGENGNQPILGLRPRFNDFSIVVVTMLHENVLLGLVRQDGLYRDTDDVFV